MRALFVYALLACAGAGCASNKPGDQAGTRIHDTTLTARDTVNPNDTLPHIRDSVPDSTR